mmetsp:Transcript_13620/g.21320  ORF Transcript_13620/g.21320 Transcript_13620/m.21320 type:complete len:84 (+) Transcript_13620:283-534(+)
MHRHQMLLQQNRIDMEKKLPVVFKFSSELLNLQKMQLGLAKQKKYKEANQLQIRCQTKETAERDKYILARDTKILKSESNLAA